MHETNRIKDQRNFQETNNFGLAHTKVTPKKNVKVKKQKKKRIFQIVIQRCGKLVRHKKTQHYPENLEGIYDHRPTMT